MKRLVKVVNDITKLCDVFTGTDIKKAIAKGFKEENIEQDWEGNYYIIGYATKKPKEIEIKELEKEIEKINIAQIRDITIINTSDNEQKIQEAKAFLQIKQDNKNKLIEKINSLRGD